jgi:hypothetical protein
MRHIGFYENLVNKPVGGKGQKLVMNSPVKHGRVVKKKNVFLLLLSLKVLLNYGAKVVVALNFLFLP